MDAAIKVAGWPFNLSIMASLEENTQFVQADDIDVAKMSSSSEMTVDLAIQTKSSYLNMIINHDSLFIDAITQTTLKVDEHCVPLELVASDKWAELVEVGLLLLLLLLPPPLLS